MNFTFSLFPHKNFFGNCAFWKMPNIQYVFAESLILKLSTKDVWKESGDCICHWPLYANHPLCFACLWRSCKANVVDAAGAKEQPSDKPSEVAPARFTSDVRKCFSFHVSKHVSAEKSTETEKNIQTEALGVRSKPSSQEGTFEDAETCETFQPKIKTECQMVQKRSGKAITNGKTSIWYQSWMQEVVIYTADDFWISSMWHMLLLFHFGFAPISLHTQWLQSFCVSKALLISSPTLYSFVFRDCAKCSSGTWCIRFAIRCFIALVISYVTWQLLIAKKIVPWTSCQGIIPMIGH